MQQEKQLEIKTDFSQALSVFNHLTRISLNGTLLDYSPMKNSCSDGLGEAQMSKTTLENSGHIPLNPRKILMVTRDMAFSAALYNHCVHLAERLSYDLVGLSVDTRFDGALFENHARRSAKSVQEASRKKGVRFEHLVRTGELGIWIEEITREIKRVEIVVVDMNGDDEEIRGLTVPVISVVSKEKGGKEMTVHAKSSKLKTVLHLAGYGAVSAAAYAAVFTHTDAVMQLFTRGGWYASLPIATVLAISFVYGAFASSLWSMLGVEAHKRDHVRRTERKVIEKRKQLRKRPRLYAYINPFHRIDM